MLRFLVVIPFGDGVLVVSALLFGVAQSVDPIVFLGVRLKNELIRDDGFRDKIVAEVQISYLLSLHKLSLLAELLNLQGMSFPI